MVWSVGPEMISGVRASSIRMLSTSSTIPEIQVTLHALIQGRDDEIVTEVVEAVLVVRAVRNVGAVRLESGTGAKMLQSLVGGIVGRVVDERGIMLDDACGEAERMVELPHPLRVAFGQVVVDRDQMGAFALEALR